MHRTTTTRDRAAAALYATLGAAMLLGAVVLGSVLLGVVAAIVLAFAVVALRSYPIDDEW